MTARIATLTAELRSDSAAVATAAPRLSWTVETTETDWVQAWAELRRGDDVVRLTGRHSVLVGWPFTPLAPGERARIEVRAASTSETTTSWSEPLELWSAIAPHWSALPIALPAPTSVAQPALLRTTIEIDRPVRHAWLYWTAFGSVDLSLNGTPVSDGVLTPGWTSYHERLVYESADVTDALRPGENVIGAILAGAWYTEEYAVLTRPTRFYGDQPRLFAQLVVAFEDGSTHTVATNESWRATGEGPTVSSGIYAGEHADARREQPGWDAPGFDDAHWPLAVVTATATDADADADGAPPAVEARMAPMVRRIETRPVLSVDRTPSGRILLDFGQNLVGRLRIRVAGPSGTVVTLRHAEVLDEGELALRPLRDAAATDSYTLAGNGTEEWEPRFTFHGFRYADIDGWPGEFDPSDVEAVVLGSDLRRTGWFESSDELVNRLHENVVWTLRGNYLAVPQDCPQRDERLGWTGDTQLFAPTASFLFDCHAFLRSWLRDLRIEQRRLGGLVPLFAPDVVPGFSDRGPMAGWGDAIAIIPRVLADSSGDHTLLSEFYPGMRDWTDLALAQRDADGLWTSGRQLADWLDPNAPPNAPSRGLTDTDIVASAYLVSTTRLTADIAHELGETADAERFATAAEATRLAFVDAYVTRAGRMMCDTQTAYALAISFDIVTEPELRQRVADRLADVVRRDGFHIATGLVGTAVVAQALTAGGHLDAAERLLLQTEAPSWLYPVTVGATTVWERWDGLREDGTINPGAMISFNHVALGSVAAWLHTDVAGLNAEAAGYRRIRIQPQPLRALDHARAALDTPYGRAESGWERAADGTIIVTAVIPANTTAAIVLPNGDRHDVGSGTHSWIVPDEPTPVRPALNLDSSMAALVDDPAAYRAFFAILKAHPRPFLLRGVRANSLYTHGRSIRDALIFADAQTLDAVAAALAEPAAH